MTDNDLLSIFRAEVTEYLESLNNALLQIEMIAVDDPAMHPMLIEMNRVAHSMKGAARAVGMTVIEQVSHDMEEVFSAALRNRIRLTPDTCDTLYDGLDLIEMMMEGEDLSEETLAEVLEKLSEVVARSTGTDSQLVAVVPAVVTTLDESGDHPEAEPVKTEEAPPRQRFTPVVTQKTNEDTPERLTSTVPVIEAQTLALRPVEETVRITVSKLDRLMAEATELLVARMHGEAWQHSIAELRHTHNKWQREWRGIRAAYIRLVRRIQDSPEEASPELLILIKFLETNQRYLTEVSRRLAQLARTVAQDTMHLTVLADQLQEDIGGMRLIPFDFIVSGFQRTVRDLARDMDKQIHLEVTGASVEIDKTVLDALKDPLMHLIRNSIDHGIEKPAERTRRGKSPIGLIQINVEQRGSEIIIVIADDGRGIDLQRIRRSLVKQKIMSEPEAQAISDDEARFYIFHPGFTTSDKVTSVSGRGMGMDIVRDRVESLRGRINVQSEAGQGTTVRLNVPVSLTRIRCILAQVGDQQFAIPSVVVARMQVIQRDDIFTAEGQEMTLFNDQPVPVVSMSTILDVPSTGNLTSLANLLILQTANRTIAFEVDALLSEQELVLKPLGHELARARYVSGAALPGTGDVVIILDANDLVRAATGTSLPRRRNIPVKDQAQANRVRVLVVDDSITTRTLEKNILETAGFEVQVAIDGAEAWSMLGENEFDVVISDVEMPNMTGLELTVRIKQSNQLRQLPVILLTSLSKPEQQEAGLRAGADAYLIKSRFDQSELLRTIQSVL